jgi:hypothetical protein
MGRKSLIRDRILELKDRTETMVVVEELISQLRTTVLLTLHITRSYTEVRYGQKQKHQTSISGDFDSKRWSFLCPEQPDGYISETMAGVQRWWRQPALPNTLLSAGSRGQLFCCWARLQFIVALDVEALFDVRRSQSRPYIRKRPVRR